METILAWIHLTFVAVVTLFPPVNPIGTALIVDPFLHQLSMPERKQAAFRIAFYCFLLCAVTAVIGSWIFNLFGISLPVVELAGGLLICQMGWNLLSTKQSSDAEKTPADDSARKKNVDDLLFYPLAFPMTTGAGSISVVLTLSAHGHDQNWDVYVSNLSAIFMAILLTTVMIYLCYAFTPILLRRLGAQGELVVNRLSAFLVFCVGLQIAVSGARQIFGLH
ncbi:MAG: MarC family protein [Bdellovibrionaceae bacterium]|nr:MarC family protein [Pseudobdellovibrionaceae bacterium]MBX3035059.1 MarC family protein [Pseudobdellovibrionaceae bacterium]